MRLHGLASVVLVASTARAVVLGGGIPTKDCRLAFGAVDATDGQSGVVCTDGDPGCDRDGLADGACVFTVRLCTGVPLDGCDPIEIEAIDVAGLALARPALPSSGYSCGRAADVTVPAGTAVAATAIALSDGAPRDVDYLNLCCRTTAGPLDASRCAVAVEPAITGCRGDAVVVAARRVARARDAVARARARPETETAELRHAVRALERVRRLGLRIAGHDPCGDALALVASHAIAMIQARR